MVTEKDRAHATLPVSFVCLRHSLPFLVALYSFPCRSSRLLRGRKNPTNILFAGLCFFGALINADVALVSLIADKSLALKVDRGTYFFFVFSLPVFIQFVHAFLGNSKDECWLEYLAYFFSLIFLFFTPSSLFISGLNTYQLWYYCQAGPIYHAFAVVAGLTVGYCFIPYFLP